MSFNGANSLRPQLPTSPELTVEFLEDVARELNSKHIPPFPVDRLAEMHQRLNIVDPSSAEYAAILEEMAGYLLLIDSLGQSNDR